MSIVKLIIVIILILSFPLLEASIFIFLTLQIGILATFGSVLVSTLLGVLLDYIYLYLWKNRLSWSTTSKDRVDKTLISFVVLILFLVPGFLTDIVGILLLLPPIQERFLIKYNTFISKLNERSARNNGQATRKKRKN